MEEKVIRQGTAVMARHDPDRTHEQHEKYVRAVLNGIEEHLVLRCLYNAVVEQLHEKRPV